MGSRKLPYLQLDAYSRGSGGNILRFRRTERGCVPLDSPSGVSLDRLPPGREKKSSVLSSREAQQKKQQAPKAKGQEKERAERSRKKSSEVLPEAVSGREDSIETCDKPPVFDLQDIPIAMENIRWPVAAALARSWFGRERHVYDDDSSSIQPIDDTTITLDWVLGFGKVRQRYEELLSKGIYSENSLLVLRKKISRYLKEAFAEKSMSAMSFNTGDQTKDLRQFANDWQFQFVAVSTSDTANGNAMSDLTGALANFNIYAAVGNFTVTGERYHRYDGKGRTKTFCMDPIVEITHVFVYVKDNYSFNDADGKLKSQYLGHWNKTGVIVTLGGMFSDRVDGRYLAQVIPPTWNLHVDVQTDLGSAKQDRSGLHTPYLTDKGIEMLVDTRQGWIRRQRAKDIYFPVFNRTYNEWRERHQQGGDFMVYSKPKYLKLKQAIRFKLETLCRAPEPM